MLGVRPESDPRGSFPIEETSAWCAAATAWLVPPLAGLPLVSPSPCTPSPGTRRSPHSLPAFTRVVQVVAPLRRSCPPQFVRLPPRVVHPDCLIAAAMPLRTGLPQPSDSLVRDRFAPEATAPGTARAAASSSLQVHPELPRDRAASPKPVPRRTRPSRHPGAPPRQPSDAEPLLPSRRPVTPALPIAATRLEILDSTPKLSPVPSEPPKRVRPRRRSSPYAADSALRSCLSGRATWTAPEPWSHFPHQLGPGSRVLSVR